MKKVFLLILTFIMLLTMGACVTPQTWAVKIGEHSASAGMYKYQLEQIKANYLAQNSLSDSPEIWEEAYDDEMTLGEYMEMSAINTLVNSVTWRAQFDHLKLSFTDAEQQAIQSEIDKMVEDSGGKEMVEKTLKEYGLSFDEFMEHVYYDTQKIIKVVEFYYGENGLEPVADEAIFSYYQDNYTRCKHILISTQKEDGTTVDDATKKIRKDKAQQVFEKAKVADEAAFDKLVKEYNEDEGVATQPDGYVFTTGEMVEEFEKAAFDMEVGETRLVETDYGYHIIRKLTLDDEKIYTPQVRQKMLMDLKSVELAEMFAGWQSERPYKVNQSVVNKYSCEKVVVGENDAAQQSKQMEQLAEQMN